MTKTESAQLACEKVLNGIEDDTITTTSALLQCLKIARLLNDVDAIIWLQYEYGGYPKDKDGVHIPTEVWNVGYKNGRGFIDIKGKCIFTELASELEKKVEAEKNAVNNFTTKGASVSGDYAAVAVNNLTASVTMSTRNIVDDIGLTEKNSQF